MMRKLKFAALMIPAAVMALLCGCGLWRPIEPMFEDRAVELPPDATGTTTPETTTETTTTTDVYTPDADEDLREMVASMTLRERIGQLLLVSCSDEFSAKYAAEQGAGGLCLFAPVFQWKTADDVRTMTSGFQSGAQIPMLISVDEEGGTVNRVSLNGNLRETPFESPRALNEQGGLNRIENDTKEKAQFLLDLGINVNLAPVCDVPEAEGNFIYPRSFSTDAKETAEYIRTVIGVMNGEHLGSCLKHFPGYGGSSDTHYGMAWDKRELDMFEKNDFLPFKAGVEEGADSVMVSHNIVECMDPDRPASLSPDVHKILREELLFRGVIISDDLGMGAISSFTHQKNPAATAIIAGNDMICYSDFDGAVEAITEAIETYKLKIQQVDDSVLRILAWKRELGLI